MFQLGWKIQIRNKSVEQFLHVPSSLLRAPFLDRLSGTKPGRAGFGTCSSLRPVSTPRAPVNGTCGAMLQEGHPSARPRVEKPLVYQGGQT